MKSESELLRLYEKLRYITYLVNNGGQFFELFFFQSQHINKELPFNSDILIPKSLSFDLLNKTK